MTEIDAKTPMEELTIGGNIYNAGNAREFKTMWIVLSCMS